MIINWLGKENFLVKTRGKTVKIGSGIALDDLKIDGPGEYEADGIQLESFDGIIEIFSEKMTIAWIKKAKLLSNEELEHLNGIDVLILGLGGGEFTETKTVLEVVNQIEPKIVIPMYNQESPSGKTGLEAFAKEESTKMEGQDQYKFALADLPQDERRVIILNVAR